MTFESLGLPYSYGHGVWSQTENVIGDDWATAEDTLTQAAQTWLSNGGAAAGYHVFKNTGTKQLTLDLMRGA